MRALRGIGSTLLLVLGLLLLAGAVPAVWADRYVLETEPYTEAVAPLIEEPVVQQQVATAIAAPISDRLDLPSVLDKILVDATAKVVATDSFAGVWADAVRLSHQHAVEGLRDEGTGLNLVDDGIVVDRAVLVEALKPRLAEAGLPFADRIPPGEGTLVLASGPDVARATTVARLVDVWAVPAAVCAGVLLLAGVIGANHRPRALVIAGLGIAGVAGALWLLLGAGTETTGALAEVDDGRRTAVLLWEALSTPLSSMITRLGLAGAGVALLGAVTWLVRR